MSLPLGPIESTRLVMTAADASDALVALREANADHLAPWLRAAGLPRGTTYAIRTRASETLVGAVIVTPLGSAVEVSYWLAREYTGVGFAREAVSAVVDAVFAAGGASFAVIRCDVRNIRGSATAAASGFVRVAGDNVRETWTRLPKATESAVRRSGRSRPGIRLIYVEPTNS